MSMSDPIADMLTRIRNANAIKLETVDIPASTLKRGIAEVLHRNGFIREWRMLESGAQGTLRVFLKYGPDGEFVINRIQRVSTPGRRVYRGVADMPKILDGLGVAIVSTSRGILSDNEARTQRLGGEVLAEVW